MTREEELKGLESVCSFLGSMSDDERFEYLMKNSKSFKKEMEKMLKEFGLENVDRVGVKMTNGVMGEQNHEQITQENGNFQTEKR